MKKVSIIVTVYNVEAFLEKCLDSLVSQTLDNFEVIVVNDGSPDDSQKIIDKYKKKYPEIIKAYKIKNRGLGGARNYALEKCSGEYVLFVDSDDYIDLTMAEEMYKMAKKDKSDIVLCGYDVIDEATKKVISKESAYSPVEKENPVLSLLFGKTAVWNKLYKTSLIKDNNIKFRSKVWYEDIDFSFKTLLLSKKNSFIDEPFYKYLIRNGSIMNNNNIERCLEICLGFDELINYCQEKEIYNKYYEQLEFYAMYHIYICAITRVINTNNKYAYKKEIINKLKEYVNKNFPNFKKNKYINHLDKNKKIIIFLIDKNQYKLIELIFKIRSR